MTCHLCTLFHTAFCVYQEKLSCNSSAYSMGGCTNFIDMALSARRAFNSMLRPQDPIDVELNGDGTVDVTIDQSGIEMHFGDPCYVGWISNGQWVFTSDSCPHCEHILSDEQVLENQASGNYSGPCHDCEPSYRHEEV